jgi:two-component system KDP operon response regulator KdpE
MKAEERKPKPSNTITVLVISEEKSIVESIENAFAVCMPETDVESLSPADKMMGYLKDLKPDILILDLDGSGDNCFDILSRVHLRLCIPVITLSQNQDISFEVKALQHGSDSHLVKPVHQMEMVARVRACLRRNCPECN